MSELVPSNLRKDLPPVVAVLYSCGGCQEYQRKAGYRPGVWIRVHPDDITKIQHVQCFICQSTMNLMDVREVKPT